ncbi:Mor transcription activator family protein [Thauera mechernichensis]|uniref:Mor transcription activator family protein n=1 Tax=Thauera mechernichensis TaxID=82788 RepID=A0ABW3WG71_9RHOO|nr:MULTISPECIES: Mor transcription activator family protein [Thauera]ENO91996.1 putative DNA transposition protein [Thauera sp. 28]MDG3063275.1 Mor transcription activator family protein [Thauera mechernichensis]
MSRTSLAILETDLPASVRDLVRWVGWRGAMALIREMPGARIYSPMRGPHWSARADARFARVAELVGERNAEKLYEIIAGTAFEVPNCRAALRRARNRAVRASFDAGAPVEALCVDFGLSRRQVYSVLKEADEPTAETPRQADLRGQMGLF